MEKDDAGIGRRGSQRELDPLAAVQTDADGGGQSLEGALGEHGAYFSFALLVLLAYGI